MPLPSITLRTPQAQSSATLATNLAAATNIRSLQQP
uniref:Uncharacterized protein n=1 Tax=Setaria italica TaxID=4555 RepID=K3ZFU5_SETIT